MNRGEETVQVDLGWLRIRLPAESVGDLLDELERAAPYPSARAVRPAANDSSRSE
jgi:hypothetical protein